jgi:8-oxo-dGTP diphosphatase
MPLAEQKINPARYQIIPRVLIFAIRTDAVLLIKLLSRNGKVTNWTGRYNGPGGHVERGEDLLSAARRELLEETGLTADLSLCGTIIVDTTPSVGIGLFVFRADNACGYLIASPEGIPEWVPFDRIGEYPLVDDVAILLERIRQMGPGDPPFAGRSFYDEIDRLTVIFN